MKDQKHYEDKIAHVQERIELEKLRRLENSDDEPTAYDKYTRAWNTYKAKKEQIQEIDSTSKRMNDDLENRRKRWTQYRDFISYSSSMKFNETRKSTKKIEFVADALFYFIYFYLDSIVECIVSVDSQYEKF